MNVQRFTPNSRVLDARALVETQRREMFALFERYYAAASYARFCSDLADKDHVIALYDADGALQGFTTLSVYTRRFEEQLVRVVFSGDTVVDESHWGQQSLSFAWVRLAGALKAAQPQIPLYWFLISKGHRTYRYLSVFSRRYFPDHARPTPARARALMDYLASDRFGAAYDRESGVLRFAQSRGQLHAQYAEIPAAHRRLPEVEFFLQRNPGYAQGDELVCLCELEAQNLRPLARRVFSGVEVPVASDARSTREPAREPT